MTVDGHGNALTWDSGHWSGPVPIDASGAGLQSVSCASATFCAAGDWNGNALTWNGTRWSKPVTVDPTTSTSGGGLSSMSCPVRSFCMATDWNGGEVSWDGTSWSKPVTFDPNGAGGLISVSCVSPGFCRALDGSDALGQNRGSGEPITPLTRAFLSLSPSAGYAYMPRFSGRRGAG
jgi:hypothetical protein